MQHFDKKQSSFVCISKGFFLPKKGLFDVRAKKYVCTFYFSVQSFKDCNVLKKNFNRHSFFAQTYVRNHVEITRNTYKFLNTLMIFKCSPIFEIIFQKVEPPNLNI